MSRASVVPERMEVVMGGCGCGGGGAQHGGIHEHGGGGSGSDRSHEDYGGEARLEVTVEPFGPDDGMVQSASDALRGHPAVRALVGDGGECRLLRFQLLDGPDDVCIRETRKT